MGTGRVLVIKHTYVRRVDTYKAQSLVPYRTFVKLHV